MTECAECDYLLQELMRRQQNYLEAFSVLLGNAESGASEFLSLRVIAAEAQIDMDLARAEYVRHRATHELSALQKE